MEVLKRLNRNQLIAYIVLIIISLIPILLLTLPIRYYNGFRGPKPWYFYDTKYVFYNEEIKNFIRIPIGTISLVCSSIILFLMVLDIVLIILNYKKNKYVLTSFAIIIALNYSFLYRVIYTNLNTYIVG